MSKIMVVLAILLIGAAPGVVAQDASVTVTLAHVLLFEYPGVEWTLNEPSFPEEPEITYWLSDQSKPIIADLEAKRDTPSAALLEAVRTNVFPDPPPDPPPPGD